jgi:hypothetical protein
MQRWLIGIAVFVGTFIVASIVIGISTLLLGLGSPSGSGLLALVISGYAAYRATNPATHKRRVPPPPPFRP